jgi:hypothetical protein
VTTVKTTKSNIPVSAKGDATQVSKSADSYSNSGTDEGYIPILADDRIFTLFTNTYAGTGPTANRYDIGCVEKVSGDNCPGYPKDFSDSVGGTDFMSPLSPVHHYDEETGRIFGATQRNTNFGVFCFDTTIDAMCSGQEYTQLQASANALGGTRRSRVQQLTKIGSCLYTFDITLKVYSYDPSTGATPCAGNTTKNLAAAYGSPVTAYNPADHTDYGWTGPIAQSQTIGTKMYIYMNYAYESNLDIWGCNNVVDICKGTRVVCFDSTTGDGRCSNGAGGYFSNPRPACYNDRFCKLVQPFINKVDNSVCAFAVKDPGFTYIGTFCHNPLTGAQLTVTAEVASIGNHGYAAFDMANYLPTFEEVDFTMPNGDEATIFAWKKAYLIASPRSGKAVCFNWTTNSLCSGFGRTGEGSSLWDTWTHNGVTSTQVGDNGDTNDYGYTSDGAGCIWAKGKSGDIWSFDAENGSVPCRRYSESVSVEPTQYYCDAESNHVTGWNEAKLQFPIGTSIEDLLELNVTIRDDSGNVVSGYESIDLLSVGPHVETLGSLDISDISASTYPELTADISFKASNSNLWVSQTALPLVVLTFEGDAPQVCYQTQVDDACNITTPLTNNGVVQLTDENQNVNQVSLSATSIVQYDDGESCVPDIRVTTTSPPGKVFRGDSLTYDILVENIANGDPLSAALDINLTNTIPDGSTYVSSNGGTLSGSVVSWPTFNLEGSASRTFTVTVIIGSDIGSALNVTSAELTDDPTASNNSYITAHEVGALATLGAIAWLDENADGIADNTEYAIQGIDVELYQDDTLISSSTTDEDGYVEFSGLAPGTGYFLTFDSPENHLASPQNTGSDDAVDSDIDTSTFSTESFALSEGENHQSTFAGFYLDPNWVDDPGPGDGTGGETPGVETSDDTLGEITTKKASSDEVVEIVTAGASDKEEPSLVSDIEKAETGRAATSVAGESVEQDKKPEHYMIFGSIPVSPSNTLYVSAFFINATAVGLFMKEKLKSRSAKRA